MSPTHRREFTELPITIDRTLDVALSAQIAAALREAIDRDALRPGEPVPATRELSIRLGVARGVVVTAYQQLLAEGYLAAGHGRGTRVHPELRAATAPGAPAAGPARGECSPNDPAPNDPAPSGPAPSGSAPSDSAPSDHPHSEAPAAPAPGSRPLAPGLPDTSAVGTPEWRSAWRTAAAEAHHEAPAIGDARLREAITEHLRRMRGTTRSADDVIVTAGAREGLSLLLTALGSSHARALTVGVEDPGYPSLRKVAARFGAKIVALPVDAEGLVTATLPTGLLDAIIVTPSHQYPLGGSLPLSRRRELLDWAKRSGAVIIEDDYDSELRHTGSPLPALAALDDPVDGSVVLLGTFSKTVSQSLSAGYLLAPARLGRLIAPVRRDLGGPVSTIVQAALASYLASGGLRRHTTRMRKRYAQRRELVVERLFATPGARVRPMSGGLHAVIEIAGGERAETAIMQRCAGLGVVPLSSYWHGQQPASGRFGLVIGTGGSSDHASFEAALTQLRAALTAELSPAPVRAGRARPAAARPHD